MNKAKVLLIAADAVRGLLVVGIVAALISGQVGTAFRFAVVFGLTVGARLLRVPLPFGLALTIALAAETWGRFVHLYRIWDPFDELIHLAMMACLASLIYLLMARIGLVPQLRDLESPRQRAALPLLAGIIGLALGALWEVYEWFVVSYLHLRVLTSYGDAMTDLLVDLGGAALGGVMLIVWAHQRWPNETTAHHGYRPKARRSIDGARTAGQE